LHLLYTLLEHSFCLFLTSQDLRSLQKRTENKGDGRRPSPLFSAIFSILRNSQSEKLFFVVYSERILVPTRFLLSFMTPSIPSPASLFWEEAGSISTYQQWPPLDKASHGFQVTSIWRNIFRPPGNTRFKKRPDILTFFLPILASGTPAYHNIISL
jgi:hypothetical protein